MPAQSTAELERAMGVEPTSPAWEAGVMTVIRRPLRVRDYSSLAAKAQQGRQRRNAPAPQSVRGEGTREPVGKPGSVASNHSSRAIVADCLLRPTRSRRGPRHRLPIWPCSRRECLAGPVARTRGALLPHPFTLADRPKTAGGLLSAAPAAGLRLPGITWRPVLWSPDFPRAAPPRWSATARGCLTDSRLAQPTPFRLVGGSAPREPRPPARRGPSGTLR